jgi:hypothetical protein
VTFIVLDKINTDTSLTTHGSFAIINIATNLLVMFQVNFKSRLTIAVIVHVQINACAMSTARMTWAIINRQTSMHGGVEPTHEALNGEEFFAELCAIKRKSLITVVLQNPRFMVNPRSVLQQRQRSTVGQLLAFKMNIFMMTAIVDAPTIVSALIKPPICINAAKVIKPNLVFIVENGFFTVDNWVKTRETQLVASDSGIFSSEMVVANGAPHAIMVNLQPTAAQVPIIIKLHKSDLAVIKPRDDRPTAPWGGRRRIVAEPNQVAVVAAARTAARVVLDLSPSAESLAVGCADILGLTESDGSMAPSVRDTIARTCSASASLGDHAIKEGVRL